MKKYDEKRYDDFGYFVIKDKFSEGFKVICDEDGCILFTTYKSKELAQDFIDRMINILDNSKVRWHGY